MAYPAASLLSALRKGNRVVFLLLLIVATVFQASGQNMDIQKLREKLAGTTDPLTRYYTLHNISVYYKNVGQIDSMLQSTSDQLVMAHELNNDSLLIITYNDIGNALEIKSDYTLALEFYLKGLRLAEKKMDPYMVFPFYNNIGLIYIDLGNNKACLEYMLKAMAMLNKVEKRAPDYAGVLYVNIGETYLGLNKIDSAEYFFKLATISLHKVKDDYSYASVLYDYGLLFEAKGDLRKADSAYSAAVTFTDTTADMAHLADATKYYSLMLMKQHKYAAAKKYSLQGYQAAIKSDYKSGLIDAAENLNMIYAALGNKDSAYFYGNKKIILRDSVFNERKINQLQDMTFKEQVRETELEQAEEKYRNRIKIYFLLGGLSVLLLVAIILLRNNRQKQKAYTLLEKQKQEIDEQKAHLEKAFRDLKSAQAQLIQTEKMASLGELTAGIAHEIQNPLNFVNNFSEVSVELLNEFREGPFRKWSGNENSEAENMINELDGNLKKISQHGKRAEGIVKGMLQHSRANAGLQRPIDPGLLIDEYFRLAYNNQKAKDLNFQVGFRTDFDPEVGLVAMVPEDMGRVLLNLFNNAFYSLKEKMKQAPPGYEPMISMSTRKVIHEAEEKNRGVEIHIRDNGMGIPEKILDKIFQPFFTTKPAGQGTGLGLSLSYDIVTKEHGGRFSVNTKEGEYAEFILFLPSA